ncbi:unnamed protein product [Miscanthus lutarioriparius]|uniref:Uncharacterized protein n=1 Tax=Miscanthus lutarioriparius TaxID=422564 RepID=A0A811P5J6_9POAL|nr:unnamed protein product [Miscanthus lutarioriparius]
MACRAFVLVLAALLALCAAAVSVAAQQRPLPPKYRIINPGKYKRDQQMTPTTTRPSAWPSATSGALTSASCSARDARPSAVLCDFYPGVSCGDPRFTGGDGNTFYFHGKKDQDFCIVTDAGLHINAHFIGKRNPAMRRDFTWIQALGIRFADHRLYMGAQKTVQTAATNGVRVQLEGVFDVVANAVPITQEDSRVHNYGVTEEDDSLAHLDLGFRFFGLTDYVHGVLGQTYRSDYVNRLSVSSNMPVMGGAPKYVSSDIFTTDCAVARFGAAGISMVTSRAY